MLERETLKAATRRIIPFLVPCYFLVFIDRVNVSVAALTMNRDLGFSPAVFAFGAGLFFVTYLFFEVPPISSCRGSARGAGSRLSR
jgi:hypothetical protein